MILSNLDYLGGSNGAGGTVGSAPSGAVMAYGAGTTDPTGWFLADGRAVSRTTFAALFTVLGTVYGGGDGSTTFNIPDLRSRFPMGADNAGTSAGAASRTAAGGNTLAATTIGEDTHILTGGESGIQAHNPVVVVSDTRTWGASLGGSSNSSGNDIYPSRAFNLAPDGGTYSISPLTGSISSTASVSAASGTAHNNRPLQQVVNFIIKQ